MTTSTADRTDENQHYAQGPRGDWNERAAHSVGAGKRAHDARGPRVDWNEIAVGAGKRAHDAQGPRVDWNERAAYSVGARKRAHDAQGPRVDWNERAAHSVGAGKRERVRANESVVATRSADTQRTDNSQEGSHKKCRTQTTAWRNEFQTTRHLHNPLPVRRGKSSDAWHRRPQTRGRRHRT